MLRTKVDIFMSFGIIELKEKKVCDDWCALGLLKNICDIDLFISV